MPIRAVAHGRGIPGRHPSAVRHTARDVARRFVTSGAASSDVQPVVERAVATNAPQDSRWASGALAIYLREIGRHPLLTREQESALAPRIRAGDQEAVDALVRANLRFVVTVAQRYQHRGLALEDLVTEGNLGLVRAARRFDETRGVRFITYAVWWVRQAIVQALA